MYAPVWAYEARSQAAASTYLAEQAGRLLGVMLIATLKGLVAGRSLFLKREPEEPWIRRVRLFGVALAVFLPFTVGLLGVVGSVRVSLDLALFMCVLFGLFPAMTLLPHSGSAASSGSSSASSSTSSSSSSSYSSSSSSSSSGYSGGGGSFGGGGASSSW
ncbi:hypothetical protein [Sorangium sp. So ce854]|uniref:hypothetical protein n=1 Tax=Sorangium sp. So ce854 TaxID=3133322 RepID=UPI003F62F94A